MILFDYGMMLIQGLFDSPNFLVNHLRRELSKVESKGFDKLEFEEDVRIVLDIMKTQIKTAYSSDFAKYEKYKSEDLNLPEANRHNYPKPALEKTTISRINFVTGQLIDIQRGSICLRDVEKIERALDELMAEKNGVIKEESGNVNFTLSRQVLAIHYLLEYCKVSNIDNTAKARFIQFVTGRQTNAKNIKNTSIYTKVRSPLAKDDDQVTKDLQFIRGYFEELGLSEVAKAITNEISSRES